MKTRIRKIGNSAGVLLSKNILSECKINEDDEVSLLVVEGKIVIEKLHRSSREGWEQQLKSVNALNDQPETDIIENDFDKEEWTW